MDKQYLREKLEAMRQNFVESTHHERAVGVLDEAHMSKKMLKIKKKLVALEMERCQKKLSTKTVLRLIRKSKSKRRFLNLVVKKIKEELCGITHLLDSIFICLNHFNHD